MVKIIDFSECSLSDRAGTYGGAAGLKDGIIYNGEYWLIKYPKSTKGMNVADLSYTTAPLSEYIGSQIYEILGYDTHKTLLGIRRNKIVVACKDFCETLGELREIRTIKNLANAELAEKLECELNNTSSSHMVSLEETLLHLEYNDILSQVDEIKERFWDMVIIDSLINNNDRNNGNWGVLYKNGEYRLAPIYDNGAAFSNKTPDKKLKQFLSDPEKLKNSALNVTTVYELNDKPLTVRKIIQLPYNDLKKALIRNIPVIKQKMGDIKKMIQDIPAEYNGLYICSEERKQFYIKSMESRLEHILQPAFEKVISESRHDRNS